VRRTAVFLLFLCDTEDRARELRERGIPRPCLIGTPEQLVEQVGQFAEIGVDELIVPDFNLGDADRRLETADRFMAEVAAAFA
ncbi:MAG: hypothetical protein AAGK32_11215, partial [Actinomycetota bacterium]